MIIGGAFLGIGAAISGYQSMRQGYGFSRGFVSYINNEWALSVAIDSILFLSIVGFSKVMATAKAGSKADKLPKVNRASECFIEGTLVKTEDGDKPIEDIKVGDLVCSENPETGEKGLKKVVQLFRNETKQWIHIHVNNHTSTNGNPSEGEEIVCTPEHPFYILNAKADTPLVIFEGKENENTNGSWVAAKDLKSGMQVLLANGHYATIKSLEVEHLETPETTYNFEVEDFHTY
jgi:intein/homing endonuclease